MWLGGRPGCRLLIETGNRSTTDEGKGQPCEKSVMGESPLSSTMHSCACSEDPSCGLPLGLELQGRTPRHPPTRPGAASLCRGPGGHAPAEQPWLVPRTESQWWRGCAPQAWSPCVPHGGASAFQPLGGSRRPGIGCCLLLCCLLSSDSHERRKSLATCIVTSDRHGYPPTWTGQTPAELALWASEVFRRR